MATTTATTATVIAKAAVIPHKREKYTHNYTLKTNASAESVDALVFVALKSIATAVRNSRLDVCNINERSHSLSLAFLLISFLSHSLSVSRCIQIQRIERAEHFKQQSSLTQQSINTHHIVFKKRNY